MGGVYIQSNSRFIAWTYITQYRFKWFIPYHWCKCHLILTTNEPGKMQESLIKGAKSVKLLGVKIDSKFTFDKHIKTICEKGTN